jgi:hypothetical protein
MITMRPPYSAQSADRQRGDTGLHLRFWIIFDGADSGVLNLPVEVGRDPGRRRPPFRSRTSTAGSERCVSLPVFQSNRARQQAYNAPAEAPTLMKIPRTPHSRPGQPMSQGAHKSPNS